MSGPTVPAEVIAAPMRPGEFIVTNPSTRTHAICDTQFLELLTRPTNPPNQDVRVRDATISAFKDGLLGDPTGLDRSATLAGVGPTRVSDAIALARRLHLLIDDLDAYRDFLTGRRLNVIDQKHRGNLHQSVGEYVLLGLKRPSVDDWWTDQKFTEDRSEPRAGLYRDVQWTFASDYYTQAELEGQRVLDFGCGPGLFARLFARAGASVIGIDTNASHLDAARRLAAKDGVSGRCEFRILSLPVEGGLESLAAERFDRIFLSDVLMFYFYSYDASLDLDPIDLLTRLRALLAPGGRIEILEPNGVFWQQPWFGDPQRPFTILTEYRNRSFGVTPTLEEISRTAESAGLAITRIRELTSPRTDDNRATGFAAEFPPWWFFELRPLS